MTHYDDYVSEQREREEKVRVELDREFGQAILDAIKTKDVLTLGRLLRRAWP